MLTRLPTSTKVLMEGISPFLVKRRSKASAALRYLVGETPKALNARRHALSEVQFAQGRGADARNNGGLFSEIAFSQSVGGGGIAHALGGDDTGDQVRVILKDVRRILKARHINLRWRVSPLSRLQ